MLVYVKNALLECVLCIVVSTALAFTACSAFYATQPFQNPAGVLGMAAVCTLLCVLLFAVSVNRTATIVGGIAIAVAMAALFAVAVAASGMPSPMDDAPGNYLYLAFCVLLPPVAVFLLARTRATCVLLIVVAAVFCAVVEYLYWYGHVVSFALAFAGSVALYVYRTYQRSLLKSESEHLAFGSVTAAGAVLAAVAVAAGVGIFAVAIAPLDPPNLVVKLVTEHYRADEREVRGIGSTNDTQNEEATDEENDEVTQSSEMAEREADVERSDDAAGDNELAVTGRTDESLFGTLGAGLAALTMNFPDWWPLVAAIMLVALVAAVIATKKLIRRRRYSAMLGRGPDAAARELYLFFLQRFAKLKMPLPETLTLQEYAGSFTDVFNRFEQATGTPAFSDLTRVYERQVYGDERVSDEELGRFCDYYRQFYRRARAYVGRVRYCRMFFRI